MAFVQKTAPDGTTYFVVDSEEDRARLAGEGHVVYTTKEIHIGREVPAVRGISSLLFAVKKACPSAVLLRAREIPGANSGDRREEGPQGHQPRHADDSGGPEGAAAGEAGQR